MKHMNIILILLMLTIQACGVKPNQVIPQEKTDFPKQYPAK